jgi:chemotaxis protein MotB
MTRRHLMPALLLLAAGCVSQGTYDDLKKKYDDAQSNLGERGARVTSLEQALAAEQTKASQLQSEITAAEARIASLEQTKASQEKELARLRSEEDRLTEELAELMKDRSRLRQSTKQLQQALAELSRRKAEADRRVAEFRSLLSKFKSLIDAGKLQVKLVDGRMVLALPTDVLFPSGSAKLSKEGTEAVGEVAAVLATMKERRFQVEGHTDNVPIRTAQYPSNWELSAARALGVVKAMIDAGMAGERLSAAGYGKFHPVASNETKAGRAENRRIEIVLVPDLSMLPGFDELKRVVEK